MKKLSVYPTKKIGDLVFSMAREQVRSILNSPFREIKKSVLSKNTMDVYKGFHVYYDQQDFLEAIEFFSDVEIVFDDRVIFPGSIEQILTLATDFEYDGYGYISRSLSIGITLSEDENPKVDGILFGRENYF